MYGTASAETSHVTAAAGAATTTLTPKRDGGRSQHVPGSSEEDVPAGVQARGGEREPERG